ncbi:LytR family transcriptional attenuator [Fusobacterium naviforme]|nr:hypothetical protein F7P78_07170 [Fusobacterium naviforme]PSL09884.1 LytR family transcriptional attenuator [Fusobacterium naviforme]STO27847.1 Putative transcriptional regulator ywtF [Fusobacterium naviforme]
MQDRDNEVRGELLRGRSRRRGTARESGGAGRERAWQDKPQRRRSAAELRVRRIILLAVLELFVLAGIFAYRYVLKQYSKIQRLEFAAENVENTELSSEDIKKMKGYWNIAAFGVDSRDSSVGRGNNSDVIMIVSINRENGEIRIASVFRDSYLSLANGSYSKINAAYAIGGPELAVKALNQNLDLNITDYITFNWKAVATGVNILGGVDVDISNAEFKYINSYITETVKGTGIGSVQLKSPGMNHLDGIQAVAYARLRYMDNDYTRTERQRKIIQLCVEKAKHADAQTLSDLAGNMLSMVATSLKWDDGMNLAVNVTKYSIAGTLGFPMDRREVNMGKKGACVLPHTLESNVKQLHTFLFADQEYAVSGRVREIDNRIASDREKYRYESYEKQQREQEEDEEEEESSRADSGKRSSQETDENGDTVPETDDFGRPLHPTDADGRFVPETDSHGNPLYDYEESDADDEPPTDSRGNLLPGAPGTRRETAPDGSIIESGSAGRLSPQPTESAAASTEEYPGGLSPARPGAGTGSAAYPGAEGTRGTSAASTAPAAPSPRSQDADASEYVNSGPGHTAAATSAAAPAPTASTPAAAPMAEALPQI